MNERFAIPAFEETGLKVTYIQGEEEKIYNEETNTINFMPFCVTQNVKISIQ